MNPSKSKQKQIKDENEIDQQQAVDKIISVSQLGGKFSKLQLNALDLKDANIAYQSTLQNHSVREWAQYVQGFSYCLNKQYGFLRQDLVQLHQSMMRKDLFFGEDDVQVVKKEGSKKKRAPNKEKEVKQIYSAKNVIESLEEQSESSISNPRNIASRDQLELQEEVEIPNIEFNQNTTRSDRTDSNNQLLRQQILDDVKEVEQQSIREMLQQRKQRRESSQRESGRSTPLVPKILVNNQEVFAQEGDIEDRVFVEQPQDLDTESTGSVRQHRFVMQEFNQLAEFNTTQDSIDNGLQRNVGGRRNEAKVIIDDVRQPSTDEKQYQDHLTQWIQVQERMDELNNRMNLLNLKQDFWRDKDLIFNETNMTHLNLDQVNTDDQRKRGYEGVSPYNQLLMKSDQSTEKVTGRGIQDDQVEIQPFMADQEDEDFYPEETKDEQGIFSSILFLKALKQQIMTQFDGLGKDEKNIYNKILFDLKKENDEIISFDEYAQLRYRKDKVPKAKAFYELLVMARIGKVQLKDAYGGEDGRYSLIEVVLK